jgi:hypothetical protein
VPASSELVVVPGRTPLVLVAPHGGRRDPARRPWGEGAQKVNDLHTAALTLELAEATGGAALVNAHVDRNDVDLNRLSAAHDHAPEFLERLTELLDAALHRYGRAVVATVHGWNVVQPVVDVGLGCRPGEVAGGAVSPDFAGTTLRALVAALEAEGIVATLGARYPARARENLVQLFTTRHRDDPRPLVRGLAARGARCEAVQLECGIPLRWPGPWRTRLVRALATGLAVPPSVSAGPTAVGADCAPLATARHTLQFTSPDVSGLAALDPVGGRLLLLPRTGGLVLFTGERAGHTAPERVGALAMAAAADGSVQLTYDGPVLRFPDTAPFVDLEHGLTRAALGEASVTLAFAPRHAGAHDAGEFGIASGRVVLDGRPLAVEARAFAEDRLPLAGDARIRGALTLDDERAVSFAVSAAGAASGFVCTGTGHLPVVAASATTPAEDRLALTVEVASGERLRLDARILDRLPVVRRRSGTPVRGRFVTCAVGSAAPAGWCEMDGG